MRYFSNWFWYRTLRVSDKFTVHHQESTTVYTAIGICRTGYDGPGSVVGIATAYGVVGPAIESQWGRDFPHLSRPALKTTQPPV